MGKPDATLYALKKCDILVALGTDIETSLFSSCLKKISCSKRRPL
tara:strand:+ start:1121 stop:1255 length:135 start_codon:yes stop_codon:yes gene_type:complete